MSWLRRILGVSGDREVKPQRLDYLNEALTLERQGDYAAALTSYQLALRDQPNDHRVLQNMAIAYSKIGRLEEAVQCYRRALDIQPQLAGAHYGLAFLLLKRGDAPAARVHLEQFLTTPPKSAKPTAGSGTRNWRSTRSATGAMASAAAADGLRPPLNDRDLSDGDAPVEPRL